MLSRLLSHAALRTGHHTSLQIHTIIHNNTIRYIKLKGIVLKFVWIYFNVKSLGFLIFCLQFGLHRAKMYAVCGCDPISSLTHSKICTNSGPASFNLLIVNEQALPFKAQNRTNSYISSSPLSGLSARNCLRPTPRLALWFHCPFETLIQAIETRLWIAML